VNKALDSLYKELDFQSGPLLPTTEEPTSRISNRDWLEKGEWLAAGKRAGADKVFFVENNPVVVFAECNSDLFEEKAKVFNRIWSLARPRLLFLVSPGEITVLDLAQEPLNIAEMKKDGSDEHRGLKTLATINTIKKVVKELQPYHRDNIESGKLFGDSRFGDLENRADKALIRDLKTVRRELIEAGLPGQNAHALIARSIFIRYLEDRGIVTKDYFLEVARQNTGWGKLLEAPPSRPGIDLSERQPFYPCALANKDFAYALFRRLAHDFNGDMFPSVDVEQQTITQKHLTLIENLLYGDVDRQNRLFFYAYRFDIVPLDLISSIYEEFYHSSAIHDERKNKARQDGAFYTPPVLVEFVLSRTLTAGELKKKPRILDPACGSGTFLVESFRRIVRYEWHRIRTRLSFDELKQILRDQIAGIEVNEEAARITAFSLYLAMLHYLEPPAITEQLKLGNRLPNILVTEDTSKNCCHSIWVGNTFDTEAINSNPMLSSRFGNQCADIVVANPPWGAPGIKSDTETKAREKVMLEWCRVNNKTIGDKEPSQAFLWRSLDFLREGGRAGMLVSAGVLFKHSTTTKLFRERWMDDVRINEIFNFAHVRKFFFKGADSPFVLVCFQKGKQKDFALKYWSAKQVVALTQTQAILFSQQDVHTLRDEFFMSGELWKTYWFGRPADSRFVKQLHIRHRLSDFVERQKSGRGYQLAAKDKTAEKLKKLFALDIESFSRYGNLRFGSPPEKVHRLGVLEAYSGKRLLVQRGISEKGQNKGRIAARYEEEQFCFRHAIYGIKLKNGEEWLYKALLGTLWSSFSRYYLFMTSSNWGLWHHEIHLDDELLQLPVVVDKGNPSTNKIIAIVDKLRNYNPQQHDLLHSNGLQEAEIEAQRRVWEEELDEAVFELYGLNEEQKDLIRDCCEVTLPFFYKPFDSLGAMPAVGNDDPSWIETYARVFSRRWNAYLEDGMEMRATLHVGAHDNMVALEFFPADKSDPWQMNPTYDSWQSVLDQIGNALPQPMGVSQFIVDGVVHAVSDYAIIVIKRNERRFWTRSLAREDADATLCKRMLVPKIDSGGDD
jgi:type I restriction-modification system DNA methylase subunit